MTTLVFPSNPTVGQQYLSDTGTTWTWDGIKWIVGQLVSAPVITPPPPPTPTPTPAPTTVYDPLLNLSFPINPTVGQLYTAPDGVVYQWVGNRWTVYSSNTTTAPTTTPSQYVLPKATSTTLGGVVIGSGIDNNDGTISVNLTSIEGDIANSIIADLENTVLSPATRSTTGPVKIGSNINVTNDGTISVPTATNSTLGVVKAGTNVNIDGTGAISVAKGAGINTVADIPDVNTTSGGAGLNDGALLVYNASNNRWDTLNNLRSDSMDGGFF
jgi:hypothetical protein